MLTDQGMERAVSESDLSTRGLGLVPLTGERVYHAGDETLPAGP